MSSTEPVLDSKKAEEEKGEKKEEKKEEEKEEKKKNEVIEDPLVNLLTDLTKSLVISTKTPSESKEGAKESTGISPMYKPVLDAIRANPCFSPEFARNGEETPEACRQSGVAEGEHRQPRNRQQSHQDKRRPLPPFWRAWLRLTGKDKEIAAAGKYYYYQVNGSQNP